MAQYLLAKSQNSVQDKIKIFAYRCEMNSIPFNFGQQANCEQGCPNEMNNEHLINCPKLNKETEVKEFNQILNGTNQQKLIISKKLKENAKRRNQLLMDSVQHMLIHCISV